MPATYLTSFDSGQEGWASGKFDSNPPDRSQNGRTQLVLWKKSILE